MSAELIDLGINITEHDLITTIICSVSPVRYESLLGAWENVPDAERTMPALRERFLSDQRRLVRRQMDEKASQPLPPPPSGYNNSALQASGTQRGHSTRCFAADVPVAAPLETSSTVMLQNATIAGKHVTTSSSVVYGLRTRVKNNSRPSSRNRTKTVMDPGLHAELTSLLYLSATTQQPTPTQFI